MSVSLERFADALRRRLMGRRDMNLNNLLQAHHEPTRYLTRGRIEGYEIALSDIDHVLRGLLAEQESKKT